MTPEQVRELPTGLYRIYWKPETEGGTSFASVGQTSSGDRWFAPSNWLDGGGWGDWALIERVELITPCDSPSACSIRRGAVEVGRLALGPQTIDPELAAIVRDMFLVGEDLDAIGILANALGMVPKASASPSAGLIAAVRAVVRSYGKSDPLDANGVPVAELDRLVEALTAIEESIREQRKKRGPKVDRYGNPVEP